jgi:SNF2 family DNA or RNA helicase
MKGSHDVIASIVRQYKKGNLDILLVNPKNYGSGLNLENTTDIIMMHKFDNEIERQVIGRAQRYGRQTPLKVWYLLHDNEI